jgi:hypothetical protein
VISPATTPHRQRSLAPFPATFKHPQSGLNFIAIATQVQGALIEGGRRLVQAACGLETLQPQCILRMPAA